MSDTLFRSKAPKIMRDLMRDFGLSLEDAAAILGNLGHESGGFNHMQELKPVVAGSRGGYGWAQWTGSRRRQFEAYCQARGIHVSSDAANYGYLCYELRHTETRALPAVKAASGLRAKVEAFEQAFERAGVKHYAARERWARIALEAYGSGGFSWGGAIAAGGAAAGSGAYAAGASPLIFLLIAAGVAAAVYFLVIKKRKK